MIAYKPSQSNTLNNKKESIKWGNCINSAPALLIAEYMQAHSRPLLVVTENNQACDQLADELRFFGVKSEDIYLFPDWEVLPYDAFSPHEEIISDRIRTLYKANQLQHGVIIAPVTSCIQHLLPKDYLQGNVLSLSEKDTLHVGPWTKQLTLAGYLRVAEVIKPGEFAIRGSIIDLYPLGSPHPVRIDLFDDEIDSLRYFDSETQHSIDTLSSIEILPAHEYPLTEEAITHFRGRWRQLFSGNPNDSVIYSGVSNAEVVAGVEFYLPLFYQQTNTLFDYLPENSHILFMPHVADRLQSYWQDIEHRYEQLRYDIQRPILPPKDLYLSKDELFSAAKAFSQIKTQLETLQAKTGQINFKIKPLLDLTIEHKQQQPLKRLTNALEGYNGKVIFCAESEGRREVLHELLNKSISGITLCDRWQQAIDQQSPFILMISPLRDGFMVLEPNVMLITENDLLGEHVQRRKRSAIQQDPNTMIRSLTELNIGDPVVHITHGIGRYLGLKHIKTAGVDNEFVELEYAGGDKIFIPVDRLNQLNRYISSNIEHATLNKLGSKHWSTQKQKALKQIQDVAAKLLSIYSERASKPGFAFNKTTEDFTRFRASFPFEETPDQEQAIDSVITDMATDKSMDRLVCGDVGFGKTEVAIQAAFVAALNNKQAAILVPTTLLANQHLQSFQNRFADWPVKIAHFTRFNTPKEQSEVIKGLASGKIDIVIGTHKLLSESVKFKDLGLLVIDEEHRFGVKQKEKIKAMRANVDILTLTATPIPRTLNMAFHGIRDLSIIATPPQKRLSVKTFVRENSDALIQEAVMRELMRGGQVYYLHNDIATIQATAEKLQKLLPDVKIAVAHGQTAKQQLERIMLDFYHQRIHILLCTTIIESGIDVPTANTIIMDRADKLGLAQLHQLRGRVGRSHHQAYAYLLVPTLKALRRDAKQRLEAIAACDELGAGFNLASHDLEIRGAGEILGEEQSGHMQVIGFSLYMDMLNQAVEALKRGESISTYHTPPEIEVELRISALIPEHFIPDVQARLVLYKQLSDCKDTTAIDEFKISMIDRFGALPEEVNNLLAISKLKLQIKPMKITKIECSGEFGYLHLDKEPKINVPKLLELIQKQSKQYQLLGGSTLRFQLTAKTADGKLDSVNRVIGLLTA
ncbi:MAG: transcription-repair coupling factor [Coxiellaceae bacterium]|nr:transcription-repair coupling factor [Coxiellaceae bacterium]